MGYLFYINECVRLYQTYDTNLQSLSTPAPGRYAASATSLEIESDSWTGLNWSTDLVCHRTRRLHYRALSSTPTDWHPAWNSEQRQRNYSQPTVSLPEAFFAAQNQLKQDFSVARMLGCEVTLPVGDLWRRATTPRRPSPATLNTTMMMTTMRLGWKRNKRDFSFLHTTVFQMGCIATRGWDEKTDVMIVEEGRGRVGYEVKGKGKGSPYVIGRWRES